MSFPTGLIPIIVLRNTVVFPKVGQYIRVGKDKSVKALRAAEKGGNWIVAVAQKSSFDEKDVTLEGLNSIGTLCKIESVRGDEKSGFNVLLRGHSRLKIIEPTEKDGYFQCYGEKLDDVIDADSETLKAMAQSLKELVYDILKLIPGNTDQLHELVQGVSDLSYLTSLVAGNIETTLDKKQDILAELYLKERTMKLLQILQDLKGYLKVQSEIRTKLVNKFEEAQRQTFLREQLKTIREELGEGEAEDKTLVENYEKKIKEAKMPEEAYKLALQELKRLERTGAQSPEYHIIRSYLDLMVELPWSKSAEEKEIDLTDARKILDADHYGLDKVKKRIVQQLAVMKLKKKTKGTILLFVGPPGVGKTSLGQSIAKALGRKFTRVSLGGVRDDAEIRGHRRTYIGALPGRIITSLKRAGENNPVMMLDELDKLTRYSHGDPASALLEVLDPEQNFNFLDHYLDIGFDLSKIIFIATANTLDTISSPLLDRMEIIEVTGYTTPEKLHIAKEHLIPKQLEEHGLTLAHLEITDEAVLKIISGYTRESGVRELQRKIAAVCRGSSEKIINADFLPVQIQAGEVKELLGSERFSHEIAGSKLLPGVVTGLAWTPQGGDILFMETALMPGVGHLIITGQLGDVMKESAQIASSLLRSRLSQLAPQIKFNKYDVHVHVPAGAVPKDGPSAGIAMLTAMASLYSSRSVDPKLAMTGEITLRGAVTPVGGIKEKVIAAHRAGIEKIILPAKNEQDLLEVPEEIRKELKFHFVDHINQVLKIALDFKEDFITNNINEKSKDKESQIQNKMSIIDFLF